jgi:tetratricopeptide (TPR) repeat protein
MNSTHVQLGRNDPCHCGSGRKFKKCCAGSNSTAAGVSSQTKRTSCSYTVYVENANKLIQMGRLRECIVPLEQAAKLRPKVPEIHYDLGSIYLEVGDTQQAVTRLQKAATLKTSDSQIQFHLGLALERNGNILPAIEAFRRTIKLDQQHIKAYLKFAQLSLVTGDQDAAITSYLTASERSPRSELGQLCKAHALIEADRTENAIESLSKTIQLFPSFGAAQGLLGRLMVEAGRFEEAENNFIEAITSDPQQSHFYYDIARGRKLGEADHQLIKNMEAALSDPELSDSNRYSINLALGKVKDDCGDPAEAISYWREANRWKTRISPFNATEFQRRIEPLFSIFTEPSFLQYSTSRSDCETPILIIGLPRSGTTLVDQILSSHKEVGAAGELGFWHKVGQTMLLKGSKLDAERLQEITESYLKRLSMVSPETKRVTDKMPQNFIWVGLIHLAFPNARFIHCRRIPIDNYLSIFSTYFGPKPDFSTDPKEFAAYYQQYLRLMEHWREVIPDNRLLDVQYEELVTTPEPIIRKILDFCDLKWEPACLMPHQNKRTVKTASSWQVRQPINSASVGRWERYEPWLEDIALLFSKHQSGSKSPL